MANINRSSQQQTPSLLAHPTLYHIQQQQENHRFKDTTSMNYGDTTTMLEQHQHMFFPQQYPHHSQQQESSPNLSDLDCSEFTTTSSVSGMPGADLLLQSPPSAAQMSSSNEDYLYNHDGMTPTAKHHHHHHQHQPYQQDPYVMLPNGGGSPYYYGSNSNNRTAPAFAMSAPTSMHHHHYHQQPSLVGSLGDTTQGAAIGATAERSMKDPYEDDIAAQANLQAIMEKRRRRRESHNAVERRRRDNINERIQELGTLLPEELTMEEGGMARLNKGTILRKSVDHIRMLQQELSNYQQRVRDLEATLEQLEKGM
ncbi:hypothetical protein LRAMOSA05842 [Lichtheimia ramosa]|uniref:BHLH domain-containing protein n=1 Tax=Lichtheimia ramosa TaxID=688394 RepID=A0A077X335_9FUNG|nr:hypothetical protein LRAMOSA05842 [Lichtheimia ramosa]